MLWLFPWSHKIMTTSFSPILDSSFPLEIPMDFCPASYITVELWLKIDDKLQLFSDLGQINSASKSESPFQVPMTMGDSASVPIKGMQLTSLSFTSTETQVSGPNHTLWDRTTQQRLPSHLEADTTQHTRKPTNVIWVDLTGVCCTQKVKKLEVRDQLVGISFCLLPCGIQRLDSGYQAWGQASLLTEPSWWP